MFSLQHIEGVNETLAHSIYQAGYLNVRHVADAAIELLQRIPGYETVESATKLKESAAGVVAKVGDMLGGAAQDDGKGSFTAAPKDAKTLAEERLRAALRISHSAPDQGASDGAKAGSGENGA